MTASQTQRNVLVVDDHAPIRTVCRLSLEAAGFRVSEATDGDEALAVVKADRPDVILLDIMMPRVSGWEVAAALIADRSTDRIPVIFITARSGVSDRIRALELGAQAYLAKPFDPSSLAKTVTRVLDQIDRGERDADLAETLAALKAEQEAGKTLRPA
jgi:two-component system phosphate regulon response regulator PhoB